jgi:hypothetical protein
MGVKKIGRKAEWFNTECMDALKRKNEARIIMLQYGARSNCGIYNDYRKKANKICRKKRIEELNYK